MIGIWSRNHGEPHFAVELAMVLLDRLHQARDIRVLVKTGNVPVRIDLIDHAHRDSRASH